MVSLLSGKIVLITGASSGIGAAVARRFVDHGAQAVLADVQDEKGSLLAKELGAKYVHCDVSKEADVEQAVKTAVETFGGLDCVVNNAGIVAASGGVFEMDMASFKRTLDINLCGVMHGIKHGARAMKAAGTSGTIINMASIAGLTGEYHIADYAASKAGVVALTKVAASEVASFGIRVNAIAPGYTATPMVALAQFGNADAPSAEVEAFVASISPVKGHSILPGDIANAALYLASPLGRSVNGHVLVVDLGATTGCVGQGGSHQPQAMVNEQ